MKGRKASQHNLYYVTPMMTMTIGSNDADFFPPILIFNQQSIFPVTIQDEKFEFLAVIMNALFVKKMSHQYSTDSSLHSQLFTHWSALRITIQNFHLKFYLEIQAIFPRN